ncbi:MAG TPA: helix-turn-helix transcriptional regulator [Thermoanaerobaculia bacterium]|nr:helix-turn-helix transcriptional regulator [Thermoanaerobaculia bacterium]
MGKSPKEGTASPAGRPRPQPSAFSRAIGARLRDLREERGWTQRELDSRLGILQSKLSKYESGTHQPSLRTLVRMSNLFGVSTDYLLTGSGTPAPPLRDDRLLDRFRRLGAGGEEMRAIVLSILDAMFELGAYLEQRHLGTSGRPGSRAIRARPAPAAASAAGRGAKRAAPRRKAAATAPRGRSMRRRGPFSAAAAPPGAAAEPEN